jgi:hypothetical protein
LTAPILDTPTSGNFSTGTFTWPTFNQNTSGTAAGLSATLAVASGGTGVTTSTGSGSNVLSTSPTLVTPLLGTPTSGNFSTGTFTWPTFNQNTTGSAASATTATNLTGGSTGTVPYQSAAGTTVQLAAGTSGFYLKSNGAAAPSWAAVSTGTVTSITVAAGTGMSGGGTVSTSGTVTLTNAGVTSVNGSTGAVTIASGAQAFVAFGSTGGF